MDACERSELEWRLCSGNGATALYRTNYVEIDPEAIAHNVREIHRTLPPGVQMMAVVKADGYGHGAGVAARAALAGGAERLAVATVEEAVALRESQIAAPILVLGNVEPQAAEAVARWQVAQTVCDARGIRALQWAGVAQGLCVPVHLKLDTGMGRLGVRAHGAAQMLAREIAKSSHLRLQGVFTHFACADELDEAYTRMQCARFEDMLAALAPVWDRWPLRHAANSAATLRFPFAHYDLVRTGIALYGAPPVSTRLDLRPAMRWVTTAVLVKDLPAGESVSYGATYTASSARRVMTLPVGYADGYRRVLGNRAQVLVRGRRAPVIGRVCMDQCMADVTEIPGCEAGDEVVLLGSQGEACITTRELAGWMETIDYEVLLAPSGRVPRRMMEEAR